ncbi:MAG: penicillin acylase family protein [Planctomycetales bacterium]|nr:penicillin acylase family protein [Planctomycetales bacterium]
MGSSNKAVRELSNGATIRRDSRGIPYIRAASWKDAIFGLGYAHGRDRPTQILFARAVASGVAAERISNKPELVETDAFFRRIALDRNLDQEFQLFDEESAALVRTYCDGLNEGLKRSGRSLPMWATGFRPGTWNPESVLIVGKLLSFGGLAVSQMQNERLLLELIHAGANEEAIRRLFAPRLDDVDFPMLRRVVMANQLSDSALDLLTDLPRLAGSNAWAVSPSRSKSGGALLASDPHLEINRLPAIWYEAVLSWGDNYVMGATLPGCPLFAVARNKNVGWGVTYMKGDTVDFFVEDCRPGGDTGWQYRRGNAWHDFRVREESIGRKGASPQNLKVYENDQGTLDCDPVEPGYHLSVAWTGNSQGAGKAIASWLALASSQSCEEALEVARACPQPTLSFVVVDKAGHIGKQCCGLFPKRNDPMGGLLPVPAWDEQNHWQGWLDRSLLPGEFDPARGYTSTANEIQNPKDGPLLVTQILPDYRKRRIDERLSELESATLQDMQDLQYDLLSVQARDLLAVFLPHMPEGDVKQRLSNWDYCYDINSEEASLFQRLYINVLMEMCGHEEVLGWRRALYICTRAGYSTMVLASIDRFLMSDDSAWWDKHDKPALIRRATERLANYKPEPWRKVNNFQFINRFFGRMRVGRLLGFDSKRIPMPGCHATPFQGHVFQTATREQTFAPSYHFVTDMSTDVAWSNLPGGPNESRFSKYYQSDIENWIAGEYKELKVPNWDEADES